MNYTIIFVNTVFFSSINQVTLSLCGLLDTLGQSPYEIWKVWYRDSRKIYLKLLLTSFNHVINVMDVYTQSNQKYFSWRVDSLSKKNGNQNGNYIRQCNTHSSLWDIGTCKQKTCIRISVVFWKLCWQCHPHIQLPLNLLASDLRTGNKV
jgi:hypothetical protein